MWEASQDEERLPFEDSLQGTRKLMITIDNQPVATAAAATAAPAAAAAAHQHLHQLLNAIRCDKLQVHPI
jgi:hypothetical protein